MQRVGQGIVDGVDLGIAEQFLVAAVGARHASLGPGFRELGGMPRGEGVKESVLRALDGGDQLQAGNAGPPKHTPADFLIHRLTG